MSSEVKDYVAEVLAVPGGNLVTLLRDLQTYLAVLVFFGAAILYYVYARAATLLAPEGLRRSTAVGCWPPISAWRH